MTEVSANVSAVADQVTQAALQTGQQVHALAMQNAVHMQQLTQMATLHHLSGGLAVAQSYQGSHLRKGAEVDAQEATAEGAVYKGEAQASLPALMSQLGSVLGALQQFVKVAQTTPPQSGGYAPQAPGERAAA